MLRSLVAPSGIETGDFVLRRNLKHEDIEEALANGDCMWLDLIDPEKDEIRWLEKLLNLHPTVVDDLMRYDRRPTLLTYPEYLFLSLFQPQIKQDHVQSIEVHCILSATVFVTVRDTGSSAADSAYNVAAQNLDYWRQGMTYLLYQTAQNVVDSYYPLLDRISTRLSDIEETVLNKDGQVQRNSVYRIKQQLIGLRQMVAPQREVLSNLIGERRIAESTQSRELFRHLYERVLRVYDVIDSQRDLWSNVLDLLESQESARMADAVNRLTVLSMIFLPLTFIVGLFGLNFITTQPELRIPLSGQLVFGIIVVITVVTSAILFALFRKRGWL